MALCDDIMELVGQKVIQYRRDADRQHWVDEYNQRPRNPQNRPWRTISAQEIELVVFQHFTYNERMVEYVLMTYYAHPPPPHTPMIVHMGQELMMENEKQKRYRNGYVSSSSDSDDY